MSASVTMGRKYTSAEQPVIGALGLIVIGLLGVAGWSLEQHGNAPEVPTSERSTQPASVNAPAPAQGITSGAVTGVVMGTSGTTLSAWINNEGATGATIAPSASSPPVSTPLSRPAPSVQPFSFDEDALAGYRAVATEVGAVPAELTIADFRKFLADHKIPTFDLTKVVGYMDKVAAKDNPDQWGWHWAPLRPGDARDIQIGRGSVGYACNNCVMISNGTLVSGGSGGAGSFYSQRSAASDYYAAGTQVYARTVPLHALQLIAQIEHQFGAGRVAFMVSDYTVGPDRIVSPDPFLMAIIPNDKLAQGDGRFIIDAWDEPGFGVGPKDDAVTAP
jgi:hypothetical protein